jgi:hypothetical protein
LPATPVSTFVVAKRQREHLKAEGTSNPHARLVRLRDGPALQNSNRLSERIQSGSNPVFFTTSDASAWTGGQEASSILAQGALNEQ